MQNSSVGVMTVSKCSNYVALQVAKIWKVSFKIQCTRGIW